MKSLFETYIKSIASKFSHLETSEMGYRADFELLLKGVFDKIKVGRIDHDARTRDGNKPDFVVLNGEVPILYVEAKDIGVNLDKVEKSEQMTRYFGYANLVLTDYVEFRFYRNGVSYGESVKIAEFDLKTREITPLPENYELAAKTLLDFTQSHREPIKSGNHLAKIMGGKAQRIRDNVRHFLSIESEQNQEILRVYGAIKHMLVHDLDLDAFSDMYSQTLVYGLFVARYYDESPDNFSRQEARDLVPASNPFLQHFFDHIAGPNFDKRLSFIVDELCLVFQHADIRELIENYMGDADPVIHFYEDFLKEYDPELRKKMGAYYTPLPVVRFIVRAVDDILKNDFGLTGGLVDTSKLASGKHRVQILDPAVGTGTFISATIRLIYEYLEKNGQKGRWPTYVHNELLPRLHGFELMMAPYTIAHLKLSLSFKKTGFWKFHRRLSIYLTNSLEQSPQQQDLISFGFAESIADEAKEADKIKNETPIMVVIGNPPYAGESSNVSYDGNDVYKVEPNGVKLQERNSKWLNDDYVKFIRLAESMVEKTNEGIVAMITAHGYIDNPTFRGMRYHLMQTFEKIYVLDLHGNANKKEKAPDGGEDKNVFDIKQGVAIFIGVKHKENSPDELARVYRANCFGSRKSKFDYLNNNSFDTVVWKEITPSKPNYEWAPRDKNVEKKYINSFSITDLFIENGVGIITARDNFVISYDRKLLVNNAKKFRDSVAKTEDNLCAEVGISNKKGWDAIKSRNELRQVDDLEIFIKNISYRLFDDRKIFYHRALIWRTVEKIMKHFESKNIALISCRQVVGDAWAHIFLTSKMVDDSYLSNRSRERGYVFPLYLYSEDGFKVPNFEKEILNKVEEIVGKITVEDMFNYIYAILHSPSYREKYKEFLKIDFPRIPYPKDAKSFKRLVTLGAELRSLHLLESSKVSQFVTTYPVAGTDLVEKISYKSGKVFINSEQYFGNVPELAWNFYIGGYQPAQKWLKDRKGRTLTNEDIEHYQKLIVVLKETDRIMKEIDEINFLN